MTCALVFTADLSPTGLVVRFQDHQRRVARMAAQWAHDQAQEELKKVEQVESELQKSKHVQPDETQLLQKAREYLESATAHRTNSEWSAAYLDAQRALRPLRILMRAQWEDAVKELSSPASSPYTMSYYTLPRHWDFWSQLKDARWGSNVLSDGGFEVPPDQIQQGWLRQDSFEGKATPPLDNVVSVTRRVAEEPAEGKQCLKLQVQPRDPLQLPEALERTYIAVHSPVVSLPPGSLVRISVQVRVPGPILASPDGVAVLRQRRRRGAGGAVHRPSSGHVQDWPGRREEAPTGAQVEEIDPLSAGARHGQAVPDHGHDWPGNDLLR